MGTIVTIDVVASDAADAAERGLDWFAEIERVCSRFDPHSELAAVCARVGEPVAASPLLCRLLAFAVEVAEASGGAFDPTVGWAMEQRGFDREHRTGRVIASGLASSVPVTYRDVAVDVERGTITVRRPLVLDLGAVAKGLAIDLATRELAPCRDFVIDAGGDLFLAGHRSDGTPWDVGVRHPRDPDRVCAVVSACDLAVCTSGDYERPGPAGDGHHLLDPSTGASPRELASVTVTAPGAMTADALATAAFVLGPDRGLQFLTDQGVQGLLVTPALTWRATPAFPGRILL
jgi:thiamine biosynthesis lipoprotein